MLTLIAIIVAAIAVFLGRVAYLIFIYRVVRNPKISDKDRDYIEKMVSKVRDSAIIAIANAIAAAFNYLRGRKGNSEDPPS
jgi:hypothetical protein